MYPSEFIYSWKRLCVLLLKMWKNFLMDFWEHGLSKSESFKSRETVRSDTFLFIETETRITLKCFDHHHSHYKQILGVISYDLIETQISPALEHSDSKMVLKNVLKS
jgi:hypothetical protein